MPSRVFDFASPAGYRIAGHIELPDAPVRGWALMAHCFTCGKDSLSAVRIGRALARAGIGTLRFDFAGLGKSGGNFADSFVTDVADLVAASQAMSDAGMPPSLLIGHSLGGAAAIASAASMPTVRAVATIGAPFDVAHVLGLFDPASLAQIDEHGEADVQLSDRPFRIRKAFIESLREHDQASLIATLKRPLLIMHAPHDEVVGIDNAGAIFMAAKHPKSFVSLDDADHLLSRPSDVEYVASIVVSWSSRYLQPVPETRDSGQDGDVIAEETGAGKFQVAIHAGGIRFLADEPVNIGGLGSGPTPYDLVSAGLAACTTMTLRLYANLKRLPVERIRTAVGYMKQKEASVPDVFTRTISIEGPLDDAQRSRMLEIADRCPVHLTLGTGSRIETQLGEPYAAADPVDAHGESMEQLMADEAETS
jgi:putative redox protein